MIGYFEDLRIGERAALGSHRFEMDEMLRFARRYNPQAFHVDEERAKDTIYGGLIASGWHTAAVWMRLMVADRERARAAATLARSARLPRIGPSPGLRDMRWPTPVRPGDTIGFSTRIVEKIYLVSRPGWGLVVTRNEGVNQNGETVLSFLAQVFHERRSALDR